MTGREWLRAMVLRDRRKTKAPWTARPGWIPTTPREPLHLTINNSSEGRYRQAAAPVRPRSPALPTIDPPGCTCDLIYSRCYCPART